MRRLRIGITATAGPQPQMPKMVAMNESRGLLDVIEKLGAIPVVFAETDRIPAADYAELIDGFIAPGGFDVEPRWYGEEPRREIGRTVPMRDAFEIPLLRALREAGKPVFGICRGLQVINVAFGGTLWQDIPSQVNESWIQHSQATDEAMPVHHVSIVPGSRVAAALGETAYVNSRHHQAAKAVAPGFRVTATSPDGIVEALESEDGLLTAVQWHPEDLWQRDAAQLALFEQFMAQVAESAARDC